ncbi:hypothetical protein RA210_U20440 [Rubrivivax sp. A210]|nr:hypothetical protein RA210_U20440 [Rubrivivax sp. A210]
MDVEIANTPAILSISTFEHIGLSDYGLPEDPAAVSAALAKLLAEGHDFLVTIPGGYNPTLDRLIPKARAGNGFEVYYWERPVIGNEWVWTDPASIDIEKLKYGPFWANQLFILHRGQPLFAGTK